MTRKWGQEVTLNQIASPQGPSTGSWFVWTPQRVRTFAEEGDWLNQEKEWDSQRSPTYGNASIGRDGVVIKLDRHNLGIALTVPDLLRLLWEVLLRRFSRLPSPLLADKATLQRAHQAAMSRDQRTITSWFLPR